jgi:predicted NBD/HSP70 family sugar kinase
MGRQQAANPPVPLQVVDDSRHLIGIDLASGEFRGAVVNLHGAIRHRANIPLRGRDGDAALALVYELIDNLMTKTNGSLLGIGIGTPGLVDTPFISSKGRKIVNVLPRPTSLSNVTPPPIIVTNCLTIANPSPTPPYSRVTDSSTCRKGSKM